MQIGTIESVWRYPVKSMRGEQVDDAFALEVKTPAGETLDVDDPAFLESLRNKSEGELRLHFSQKERGRLPTAITILAANPGAAGTGNRARS